MAKKKKEEKPQAEKPPQHEAIEAMGKVFDAIPKGKFRDIFGDAQVMEVYLRRGLSALSMLNVVRQYFLDIPDLGGEESPIVKKIDGLIPRE